MIVVAMLNSALRKWRPTGGCHCANNSRRRVAAGEESADRLDLAASRALEGKWLQTARAHAKAWSSKVDAEVRGCGGSRL